MVGSIGALNRPDNVPTSAFDAILSMAVIRLHDRQDQFDNLTEQRISTGFPDHQGEPQ
jgi:hypothetical protein